MQETINYLINFLSGESDTDYSSVIGYTANQELFSQYKIVIIPSSFFSEASYGKIDSIPTLPLAEINNIPLLFGSPKVEKIKNTLVVYADIIASSYFLLTRYEEWIRTDCRDTHGRFPGKESLAFKAGFLNRPIVNEYGRLLQQWMKECGIAIKETKKQLANIYLTHDVDQLSKYRTFKEFMGGLFRNIAQGKDEFKIAFNSFFGKLENDPLFTFPWIFDQNKKLKEALPEINVESVFFFKSLTAYLPQDKPFYNLFLKDTQSLFELCLINNAHIGLHTSYLSGDNPELILPEKEQLEIACGNAIKYNRYHYLRSKEINDMEALIEAGITDDFTMGYADVVGFRLGSCKPIKWINLQTKKISTLTLHPLNIMDCSLEDERYMSLNYDEALNYSKTIVDKVNEFNGELVLLWHNSNLATSSRFSQKDLYSELLAYIIRISKNG